MTRAVGRASSAGIAPGLHSMGGSRQSKGGGVTVWLGTTYLSTVLEISVRSPGLVGFWDERDGSRSTLQTNVTPCEALMLGVSFKRCSGMQGLSLRAAN